MKHYMLWAILLLALVSCASTPQFVNHPRPAFTVDIAPFEAACPVGEYGLRRCPEHGSLGALGCDEIREPPALAGALQPSYPLVQCLTGSPTGEGVEWIGGDHYTYSPAGPYFYRVGGLSSSVVRYVADIDGQFTLVKTEEEFRVLFTPLESPEEALGYVQAVTGLEACYGLKKEPNFAYSTNEIEDTHVDVTADSYVVHMYYEAEFGCGPHWAYTVDIHVTREGRISQDKIQQAFRDTTLDHTCID